MRPTHGPTAGRRRRRGRGRRRRAPAQLVAPRPPDVRRAVGLLHRAAVRRAGPGGVLRRAQPDLRQRPRRGPVPVRAASPSSSRSGWSPTSAPAGSAPTSGSGWSSPRSSWSASARWCCGTWSSTRTDDRRRRAQAAAAGLRGAQGTREAAAPPRRPLDGRAARAREGGRPPGVPRPPALGALLPAAGRRPRADDRPAGRAARRAGVDVPARADDAAAHPRGGQGHHPQDAVEAVRRRARRVGADALPRPGHHVRLQPGRLRHGLPVLRHRPGRAPAQHVHGRDRRAGGGRRPLARPRRGARRAGPGLQRRVHGHGRADGQLQGRHRRRTPAHRPRARRARHVRPRRHRLHGRAGAADAASSPTRASRSRSR